MFSSKKSEEYKIVSNRKKKFILFTFLEKLKLFYFEKKKKEKKKKVKWKLNKII